MAEKENHIVLRKPENSQISSLKNEIRTSKKYKKQNAVVVITFILLVVIYFFSVTSFVVPENTSFSLAGLLQAWKDKFHSFILFVGGEGSYGTGTVVKYTIMVLAGAALASAGAVFQGSFKNIIASPATMGVQSGATLGNALYLLFFTSSVSSATGVVKIHNDVTETSKMSFAQLNTQQLFAMVGSFIAIVTVVAITSALGKGRFSTTNILFSGMIFSSFVGAITSLINNYFLFYDEDNSRAQSMQIFSMGNFDRVITVQQLAFIVVFLVPCLIVLIITSSKLNVLVMGEEEAATMGLNVRFYRNLLIAVGTLMSATVFAFCGQIGFMGFIVPQIARKLVGPDFKRLIVMTIGLGGLLMILVYNVAFALGLTTYLNIIISTIGCLMMIYSFFKGKGGVAADAE
ncbi:MAG: iron ABC transporter permease [Clostridia bacterium]|nr:iron ABC transporter permease [Clostridia bacterium]